MIRDLFASNRAEKISAFDDVFRKLKFEFVSFSNEKFLLEYAENSTPEIVIFDLLSKEIDFTELIMKIKPYTEKSALILLTNNEYSNKELMKYTNSFITDDMGEDLIIGIININLRMRKGLEKLSVANRDLADSNYRLNALYTTSSQFAGTLDKEKLIQYMIEGMDRALSYSLTSTLSFCSDEPVLILNSLYELSDEIINALKLRMVLHYKGLFDGREAPYDLDINTLKVKKNVKYPASRFNFTLFQFDNMFSPIVLEDNFFGCVEIFKDTPFSAENATCFQTIAQQVSLPLKSAALYQEIEEKNEKLAKLERLKSEFISIVSHELRTPLTSIKNSLEIMLSGKCGEVTQSYEKFLDMAKRNSMRLSGIINDLLDLSKIEAGKMDYHFKNIDINSSIKSVKTSLLILAKNKNQEIVSIEGENLPPVYADSQRLEQVLTNLLSNAIKFTPEGKTITIKSELVKSQDITFPEVFDYPKEKLSGEYVRVSVIDEGIGISAENLVRVFDKFAQIDSTLSRNVGGTGLGLPIAKQLIEAHNGVIWCDSVLDKGTTFSFLLPVSAEV